MSFQLKAYQESALDQLRIYFQQAKSQGARVAFYAQTDRPYLPVGQFPELPYICIRIPTGGGKTVLAAHSVGIIQSEFLGAERAAVLWLAPSNTIVQQTLSALRDRRHPYRQALDAGCPGGVTVLELKEALYLQRGVLDGETVVIVSTLQALRVDETEGRKVYESAGALQHHFSGLTEQQQSALESGDEAGKYSLANVLRLRRPIVIVDEAHNARTPLSFETLQRFNPSVILEYTATPDQDKVPSNVLHHVSAAELKAEAMIKLPIQLQTRSDWKEAVAAAVAKQGALETLAKQNENETGEYIRPIVLFQAQQQSAARENITWETVKQCLLEDLKIADEEIAVHTGAVRQLDGLQIQSRECRVKYVITVSALKEGWDCPFAYVLCSVQNLSSSTAVEQILGRVLRMPGAARKQQEELNHAYAFSTSSGFIDSARGLEDALVQSGFERFEARVNIKPEPFHPDLLPGTGIFPTIAEPVREKPKLDALPTDLKEKLNYEPLRQQINYSGPPLSDAQTKLIQDCMSSPEDKQAIKRLGLRSGGKDYWPAAQGSKLTVPRLAVREQLKLELFEDQFRDFEWKLSDRDPALTEDEFSIAGDQARTAEVDVSDKGKVETRYVAEIRQQLSLLEMRGPQSDAELSVWLDRQILHPDLPIHESRLFLLKMVRYLVEERGARLDDLVRHRFRLRDAARAKIQQHREAANGEAFQGYLFGGKQETIEVDPELCFSFPSSHYPANRYYQGGFQFSKHFYEQPGHMNSEEAKCAKLLDTSPKVEHWVRNLERGDYAFWLPTSSDRFYPDFVALLTDGRRLVVEYKGEHLVTADDAKEKSMVGRLWEAKSKGSCLFRMVTRTDMEATLLNTLGDDPELHRLTPPS